MSVVKVQAVKAITDRLSTDKEGGPESHNSLTDGAALLPETFHKLKETPCFTPTSFLSPTKTSFL